MEGWVVEVKEDGSEAWGGVLVGSRGWNMKDWAQEFMDQVYDMS